MGTCFPFLFFSFLWLHHTPRGMAQLIMDDDCNDEVGGSDSSAAVDPFADYQQPASGMGFVDDEAEFGDEGAGAHHPEQQHQQATASPTVSSPQGSGATVATSPARLASGPSSGGAFPAVDDENSPLRLWQREHQKLLAERQQKSQEAHARVRATARADIDKFYEERRLLCQKTAQHNRFVSLTFPLSPVWTTMGEDGGELDV